MIITNDLMDSESFKNITTVVFDCDGVLIDSAQANRTYYNLMLDHINLPPMTEAQAAYCHCHTVGESIAHITPAERMPEVIAFQRAFNYGTLLPHITRMDGLVEFLWWLRDAGFKLAINTSRKDSMDELLQVMDLEGYFFPIVTSANVQQPKPHPEALYQIMSTLNVSGDEMVFVGDSIVDQGCAHGANVRFWAYNNQELKADLHITDYWTLHRCMKKAYSN